MANEVELKLSLPSISVQAWMDSDNLGTAQAEPLLLDNQYFDTPDLLLNQSHAALRIRKSQHGYKQTLKNKGTAIAGLHQRGEWEYDIPNPEIDWSLFPQDVQISVDIRQAIGPLFKTDFTRHVWIKQQMQSQIEVVLDQGLISTQDNNIALCEVELELQHGKVEDIFDFALELAAKHPLVPCDINKAERGYHLMKPSLSFFNAHDFAKEYVQQADVDVLTLLQETLTRISRSWDNFSERENWWALLLLSRQVQGATYILSSLKNVPEALLNTWLQLQSSVLELLKPARVVIGLHVDGNSHSRGLSQRLLQPLISQLNLNLAQWIQENQLGQAMLKLGQFLYGQQALAKDNNSAIALSFNDVLLPQMQGDIKAIEGHSIAELDDLNNMQALAYILRRLSHPLYEPVNAYIRQCLVVLAMSDCKEMSPVSDGDSRAKLASWVRRLTVEYRQLNESRLALVERLASL